MCFFHVFFFVFSPPFGFLYNSNPRSLRVYDRLQKATIKKLQTLKKERKNIFIYFFKRKEINAQPQQRAVSTFLDLFRAPVVRVVFFALFFFFSQSW